MKKKIAILGSTGSIGKNLLNIIKKNKNLFKIILLTANTDHRALFIQAKKYNVKNLIIRDKICFKILKDRCKKTNIKVYNNFDNFDKIFKNKVDYTMNSIVGFAGLNRPQGDAVPDRPFFFDAAGPYLVMAPKHV